MKNFKIHEDDETLTTKRNLKVLEFNNKISPIVNRICSPLLDIGISIFTYSRIFNNGTRFYVCSDQNWVEYYITHDYQNEKEHLGHYIPANKIKCALWSECKMSKVFYAVFENFNYWNGITFYEWHKNYVDYFDFGSHKDNYDIINYYISNLSMLKIFIKNFKFKFYKLENILHDDNLLISNIKTPLNAIRSSPCIHRKLEKSFIEQKTKSKRYRCKASKISFTKREAEILFYLKGNRKVKDIAQFLNIPIETVKLYITNIKLKTKSKTLVELNDLLTTCGFNGDELLNNIKKLEINLKSKTAPKINISSSCLDRLVNSCCFYVA